MYACPARPRHFVDGSLDLRIMTTSDSDHLMVKCGKFFLRHMFGSVRKIISHSRVLRRFLSLKGLPAQQGTLMVFKDMTDAIDLLETMNGVMITHIDTEKVGVHLNSITSRWLEKRGRFVADDPQTGLYKKLFRLKFIYNHLDEVYSDKYNIYQAAYVDVAYAVRAVLCFVMQIISFAALMKEGEGGGETSPTGDRRSTVDVVLIVVTIMYMFFNLPANSITSSMSHNVVLFHVFANMKMYGRLLFVSMDLVVNSFIISLMPLVSARLLYNTADSASIVATSLSVFFVTSLDDSAITKSESNNMSASQSALLREVTEKVDSFVDSDRLWVVAYLPWLEMLLLVASVTASYALLFFSHD
ncbi:unnamed protein product [Ectocarpus sp. 12 AP-2014]